MKLEEIKELFPKDATVFEFNPSARYLIVFNPDDMEAMEAASVIRRLEKLGVGVAGVYSYEKPTIYEVVP